MYQTQVCEREGENEGEEERKEGRERKGAIHVTQLVLLHRGEQWLWLPSLAVKVRSSHILSHPSTLPPLSQWLHSLLPDWSSVVYVSSSDGAASTGYPRVAPSLPELLSCS